MLLVGLYSRAEYTLDYSAEFIGTAGSGNFAPHYMSSNVHGIVTQTNSSLLRLDIHRGLEKDKRFSFGYGATLVGGYASATDYSYYDKAKGGLSVKGERPAAAWIHQLYAELKYRGVFVTAGAKEMNSKILNDRLSSGDMTISSNFRPIPGLRAGFIEPQNVPFTNGWVQISGEIGYYKHTDNGWIENHYNYYYGGITKDHWLNYKCCYFNTNPDKPFSATLGLQASCQFGGKIYNYSKGELVSTVDMSPTAKSFFRTMIPGSGGNVQGDKFFVEGNHVGSIDLMGRYRFKNGTVLKAYYQNPWEDGSGLGKMNGFDGLYGIEYDSGKETGILTGAVVEYLDLMNQGGPVFYAPTDWEEQGIDTKIYTAATGGDNYYNNYCYLSGYSNYGMSFGSPMVKSPLYNTDGYLKYVDNRMRAFHVGLEGKPAKDWSYRLLFSYAKSLGTVWIPISKPRENIAGMVECVYRWHSLPNLNIKCQVGFDKGQLYGDNFGALLSVSYRGLIKF